MSDSERRSRHDLRYACFRIQTEIRGGNKATADQWLLALPLESIEGFGGWRDFAETWDVAGVWPTTLVARKWSIYQEWCQTMERTAVALPGVRDVRNGLFPA